MGCLAEVFRGRGLKFNAGKSKVIMFGEEEKFDREGGLCWTGYDWRMCRNLNIWDVFWTNRYSCGRAPHDGCRCY